VRIVGYLGHCSVVRRRRAAGPGLAPPGDGPRILAAWRDALAAGRLETPLPDLR
jgi:hypothetical protein